MLTEERKQELINAIKKQKAQSEINTGNILENVKGMCKQFDEHIEDRAVIVNLLLDEVNEQDIAVPNRKLYVDLIKRVYKELLELRPTTEQLADALMMASGGCVLSVGERATVLNGRNLAREIIAARETK